MTEIVPAPRVLLVEDAAAIARTYLDYLKETCCDVKHVDTGAGALSALDQWKPAAVLLDLRLPDMDGFDILSAVADSPDKPLFIVMTADGSVGRAIEAMRLGATDFLIKPVGAERLKVTLKNALKQYELKQEIAGYKAAAPHLVFEQFIGSSLAMQAVYRALESAAASTATVFLTGESGTGKDLAAEAIHARSARAAGPMIALNCAAIPKNLMESEIFGHVKGAFTGAISDTKGAAAEADGGTLFLDEICEMDPMLQSKLLRFIQTSSFTRVGEVRPREVDVRFVCATNRDPLAEVRAGRFREDLYYRLHVIPITLPALRDREGDVMEIANALLANTAAEESKIFEDFDAAAERAIRIHPWPGNVRELQNVIRRAVVMSDGPRVMVDMLHFPPGDAGPSPVEPASSKFQKKKIHISELSRLITPLDEVEREAIEAAVKLCDGDVKKAATLLEVSAATIYRKRKAWA